MWEESKNSTKIMLLVSTLNNCTKVVFAISDIKSTKSLNVVFTIHCAYNVHCYLTQSCTKQNK